MKIVSFLDHNGEIQWGITADSTRSWQDYGWVFFRGLVVWADQLCSAYPAPHVNLIVPFALDEWTQMIDNLL